MNLLTQRLGLQISAEKQGLDHFAQFRECLVGGVLGGASPESAQNGFGLGNAQSQCRGILNHLVILRPNQFPPDGTSEDHLQIWIRPAELNLFCCLIALTLWALKSTLQLTPEVPNRVLSLSLAQISAASLSVCCTN